MSANPALRERYAQALAHCERSLPAALSGTERHMARQRFIEELLESDRRAWALAREQREMRERSSKQAAKDAALLKIIRRRLEGL